MNNNVFIVYINYEYEGGTILGVFSSKKLASQWFEKSEHYYLNDYVRIAEVGLNTPVSIELG